ncbi:MAG: STAS domain-containing protein [Chloroflexota bacterium]
MPSRLIELLTTHKEQIADMLIKTPSGDQAAGQTPEEKRTSLLAAVDSIIGMLQQDADLLEQTLEELARSQLEEVDSGEILVALDAERSVISQVIKNNNPESVDALETLEVLDKLHEQRLRTMLSLAYQHMVEQFQKAAGDRMVLRAAVQELSTPIIPVYSGVLVLPLIGQIDSRRAQSVTESLLESIAEEQAELVIIDITGIVTIDTSVANHLMKTARAASLLGSQVILVGISAEVAQTLIFLGVDLENIVTLGDLQSGIEYALERQGLAIMPKS